MRLSVISWIISSEAWVIEGLRMITQYLLQILCYYVNFTRYCVMTECSRPVRVFIVRLFIIIPTIMHATQTYGYYFTIVLRNTLRRLEKRFTSCDMERFIPWTNEKRRKVPAVIFNISMPTKSSAIPSTHKAHQYRSSYSFLIETTTS